MYEYPLDHALSLRDVEEAVPRAQLRCDSKTQLKLMEKLDQCSRLHLLPYSRVRLGLENGMFAIPKDQHRDRLIMDARPANLCEQSEQRWVFSLGSLQQLQHLFLSPDQVLLMHCEDLREFYHAFKIGEQRRERNALKARLKPRELCHLKCFRSDLWKEEWLVPALDTMAMGDTNSVAFGQVAHLSLLLRTNEFELSDFLGLKVRPSRKDWHAGLMIDDFVLLEKVDARYTPEAGPTLGAEKLSKVREAYDQAGLPRHLGKAVESSETAEFWGAEVNGRQGRARPNLKRLIPLVHVMLKVVSLKVCSVGLVETITGSLVSAFQMRRRLLSAVDELYAAQRGRLQSDVIALSAELRSELLCCVALLVVTEIDFRLQPSPIVIASDASSTHEAAVCCELGSAFTVEAQRLALQKGLWNRLLSPGVAFFREKGSL